MTDGIKRRFETIQLKSKYDYLAPDLSEIRLLPSMKGGGLAHCTLPPQGVSLAVQHKTVEEIWYFLEGEGEAWRKKDEQEKTVKVFPGVALTIPLGTKFQFRNTGDCPLKFTISTMPPWPGADEAVRVKCHWEIQ